MPYEDAKTYRFNPFDLTKVWSHKDYPLITVGTHRAEPQPGELLREIEQTAFSPANFVPGHRRSRPDKMLMARVFSYPDAQRYRVGTNFNELPVNRPEAPVNNYSQDGSHAPQLQRRPPPGYAPNSFGGPAAEPSPRRRGRWESDGELVRAAAHPALRGRATSASRAPSTARCSTTPSVPCLQENLLGQGQRHHPRGHPRALLPVLDER